MPQEPSGISIYSPKIRDEALVRKFVSLNGTGYIAISIQNGATPVDPDADTLQVVVWFNDVLSGTASTNPYGTAVLTITQDDITRDDVGKFHYLMGPALTGNRGLITAVWTYQVGGVAFQFIDHLQVLEPMPVYDSLSDAEKFTVEQVTWMFGDMYDSTEGGPHLIEEFQTHWNYERIAQMMRLAVMKMNYIGNFNNPPTTWQVGASAQGSTISGQQVTKTQTLPDGTVNTVTYSTSSSTQGGSSAVPATMTGLVVIGTYVECLRHFRDSYTEIPQRPGMDVTYVDRSQYWQRWGGSLQEEEANWMKMVKSAKMSMLSMSRGSLLVAGGIYGGSAHGVFQSGMYAAQVRSWRFYPAAPAISWGATSH